MTVFNFVDGVKYEGPASRNTLAFKFYDADREVLGKR